MLSGCCKLSRDMLPKGSVGQELPSTGITGIAGILFATTGFGVVGVVTTVTFWLTGLLICALDGTVGETIGLSVLLTVRVDVVVEV